MGSPWGSPYFYKIYSIRKSIMRKSIMRKSIKKISKKNSKKNSKKRRSKKLRKGGAPQDDFVNVGFTKSPMSKNTLSIIDVVKGPSSALGYIPYTIDNVEEMLYFIKSGFKDEKGNSIKVDEKKSILKPNESTAP
jgi:hypothetical protein